MKNLKVYAVLVGVGLLMGCAGFDKSNEYHKAQALDRTITIPNDINDGELNNYYPIPKSEGSKHHSSSVLPPESF